MRGTRSTTRSSARTSLALVAAATLLALALGPAPALAAPELTDGQITAAVTDELLYDEGVEGAWIDVETDEGVVQLSGTTDNILARDRAVRVAQTVRGVRAVVDEIRVLDAGRADEAIRAAVDDALLSDPATDTWQIGVEVEDGEVTLTGTVDSWQERLLAGKVAKGVRGVLALDNRILVDYQQERRDGEMLAEIERTLDWDSLVDDALIDVVVRNGKVRLSGVVGSLAEKNRATTHAWVMGVTDVDAGKLEIAHWARDERLRENKYVARDEEEIAAAVEDAMLYDPRVSSFEVDASADGGEVTLTGTVDNLRAKQAAASDARNTVGVWRVKNRVKVRPGEYRDDRVESRVERALANDPYVERYEVGVEVDHGVVSLTGTVDSTFEKSQAEDVAARTFGVVAVDNDLRVADGYDILTYDPYVDDGWYVYDFDWFVYPDLPATTKPDWEIATDIRSQLWWSPFVDEDEVSVVVDDGVATLTGTVDTWSERAAATENAYDGGAILVDNDLLVSYGPTYYRP